MILFPFLTPTNSNKQITLVINNKMVKNVQPLGPLCNWRAFGEIGSGGKE